MFTRFFDLSQPIFHNCPAWPTYQMTTVEMEAVCANNGFTAERISLNSHTATHLDAPYHFFPEGKKIDEIPVERFQGTAVLVDLRGVVAAAEGITSEHLKPYADLITKDTIVLLNTGWYAKRSYSNEYYHDWPYITADAAEWLKDRGVKGVGIDGLSIGGWYEGTGRPCHEILLANEIWALEEVYFPEVLLESNTCYLMAFPLKLQGFSGAPVRVVAAL